jgi:cytochrome oxidase Cu insertion factor (SCO1/SenC/PrrC family)
LPFIRDLIAAVTVAAALAAAGPARAQPVLAPDPSAVVGKRLDLSRFTDERGTGFAAIRAALDRDGRRPPWIVSPIYTRCRATCSPLTGVLKRALIESGLGPRDYAVLSFSFDPEERADDLAAFRDRMALPPDWLTLRAMDAATLDAALTAIDFRTVALGGGQLDHPNAVAVLTADMRVSEYLLGLDLDGRRLAAALERARSGGAARPAWRWPLFTLAALGFVASAFAFVSRLVRLRR